MGCGFVLQSKAAPTQQPQATTRPTSTESLCHRKHVLSITRQLLFYLNMCARAGVASGLPESTGAAKIGAREVAGLGRLRKQGRKCCWQCGSRWREGPPHTAELEREVDGGGQTGSCRFNTPRI